jgi:surfeit locus 1 family protein
LCAGLTIWLGLWQLGRADEKRARQAAFDTAAATPALDLAALPASLLTTPTPYRRVRVSGRFDRAYQIYLDNRMFQGRPGYHVIVPLVYPGGVVLVNRGWLPAGGDRTAPPPAPPAPESVTLEGVLVPAQGRYLELSGQDGAGPVWQNLNLARYRAWYRARGELPDRLLLQTSPAADGLVRDWPRPDAGVARHLGYAVQWFAMSAAIVALYAYYGLLKRHHAPH